MQSKVQKGQEFSLNFCRYRATANSRPEGGAVHHIESVYALDEAGREVHLFFCRYQIELISPLAPAVRILSDVAEGSPAGKA